MSPVVSSVLVVGAGPAGAVAAAILATAGVRVTLVEASRFPRDKVCGECLSDLGLRTLDGHGLLPPLRRLRPVTLRRCTLAAQDGATATLDLPSPMWGVTRGAMDAALRDAARSAGAAVRQPARVESVLPGDAPSAVLRDAASGEIETLHADAILLADGKSAFPGPGGRADKPAATGDLGVKAHFRGVRADAESIYLFGVAGHYAGLAPVSDGDDGLLWNLACNVPAGRVKRFGGDHDALLAAMRAENRRLAKAMRHAERAGPWLACPLPRFAPRRDWPRGVVPAGNAAAALEPVGGEGMGLAVASAALAATALLEGWQTSELQRAYRRLWRTRRAACRSAAVLLSSPRLGPTVVRLAARWSGLGDLGLALVGKRPAFA